MEELLQFKRELKNINTPNGLLEFTQRNVLHGTPAVFRDREQEFFQFKKRICDKFNVAHTDIYIVGSAKLGFSPHKGTEFSLDSDIDLAIVSQSFFSKATDIAVDLEYRIKAQISFLRPRHWTNYHRYLRYVLIGWMRPDLLPQVEPCVDFKEDWFDFFEKISFGNSEVGNYQVTAGVFRSHQDLERYTLDSVTRVQKSLMIGVQQ